MNNLTKLNHCTDQAHYSLHMSSLVAACSFLPRDALLSAVYAVVVCLCVCVCVCVCHTPVLYQNG